MPSPRSVLIDIAEKNLDPSVDYSRLSKDGRLHTIEQIVQPDQLVSEPEKPQAEKSGLVELQDKPLKSKKKKSEVDDA